MLCNGGFGFGVNQAHEFFIMQSQMYKEQVINQMNYIIQYTYTIPDNILQLALNAIGVSKSDFTDPDWNELNRIADRAIKI